MERKYLDKSIDFILRPEKRQIMLDKFCVSEEFAHLFTGKTLITVFSQDKTQLEGTLSLKAHDRVVFTCATPGENKFEKGSILLIVPQTKPDYVLVQASVDTSIDNMVMLTSVDPRRRSRYRTRMVASIYGIGQPLFDHFKSHSARIFRDHETIRDRMDHQYIRRVVDKVEDHAKIAHDGLAFVSKGRHPHKALLADISEGGCCLYVDKDAKIDGLTVNKLLMVNIEIPHPSKVKTASVFASIRLIRKEGEHLVLHCMFVAPLPENYLDF